MCFRCPASKSVQLLAALRLMLCHVSLQVCSFRCIVSYESQLLEDFSLCILQKNNCLGLSADIPARPRVLPMTHFRGQALTHHKAGQTCSCYLCASQPCSFCFSLCQGPLKDIVWNKVDPSELHLSHCPHWCVYVCLCLFLRYALSMT